MPQTTMNALPELLTRLARLLALTTALLLAACGPGTGGTGTGPVGGVLNFAGVGFSTGVPCPQCGGSSSLRLEDERVVLYIHCRRFVHTGPWEIDAQGLAVLTGTLEGPDAGSSGATPETPAAPTGAVVRLQFSDGRADSRQVVAVLLDLSGNSLAPPMTLTQHTGPSAPGTCPAGR